MRAGIFLLFVACTLAHGLRLSHAPVIHSDLDRDEEDSYDIDEWKDFLKNSKSYNVATAGDIVTSEMVNWLRGDEFCESDRALPQVFLLGPQKAGSTTFAADLVLSGLQPIIGDAKESHVFDKVCKRSGECPKNTGWKDLERFSEFHFCQKGMRYADMTPLNLRLPGLPEMLKRAYGKERSKQLKFIILLREPIQRFISGCSWFHEYRKLGFGSIFELVEALRDKYMNIKTAGLAYSRLADQFYRSMYGAQLDSWLQSFSGSQFILIPTRQYFNDVHTRRNYINEIAKQLNFDLASERIVETSHLNKHRHPSCANCLNNEFLQGEFQKDTELLAEKIAKHGVKLVGYNGTLDSKTIVEHLKSNW